MQEITHLKTDVMGFHVPTFDQDDELVTIPRSRLHELERYENAFAATTDGIHQRDLLTGDTYRSPQWKAIVGYADDEWDDTFDDWSALLHPADARTVRDQRLQILRGERDHFAAEFRLRRRDGDYVWVRARARLTRLADGTPHGITGVFTDITRDKRMLEGCEQAHRELRRSQKNLHHVMQMANCVLWQAIVRETPTFPGQIGRFDPDRGTDLQWDFETVNDPQEDSWLPLERVGDESIADAWFRVRNRRDALEGFHRLRTALLSGNERYTQLYRTPTSGGAVLSLLEDVSIEDLTMSGEKLSVPGLDDAARLRRWRLVAVATDVTERTLAEERLAAAGRELQRTNDALQRSYDAMSEFVSVASHDLKEPLRKIQTFGSMLERRAAGALDGDALCYLTRMTAAANRMQSLIDGLLNLARTSQKPLVSETVDLNQVAAEVQMDLEIRIGDVQGKVCIESLPRIAADRLQMRQLFQNLIGNALKFHRPDVPPVVLIRAVVPEDEDGWLTLTFTDNGLGFLPEHSERIFRVFERLERTEASVEGSGVGLAICRKIVERHGGTIRAESRPGIGAVFIVNLPGTVMVWD